MAYEAGDIKVFNPNKQISTEITLEILIRHRDALKQARTGELPNIPLNQLKDNDRKINQVRALNLIISSQREMITHSRPIISHQSKRKWERKYKTDKEKDEHPFEEEDNDYNKLIRWKLFLQHCEEVIIESEKTKTVEDDFLIVRQTNDGDMIYLTENFHEMLQDLEDAYEEIYLLMLTNKIVSAGIEEDDELLYKEKEQEAIRRVVEA